MPEHWKKGHMSWFSQWIKEDNPPVVVFAFYNGVPFPLSLRFDNFNGWHDFIRRVTQVTVNDHLTSCFAQLNAMDTCMRNSLWHQGREATEVLKELTDTLGQDKKTCKIFWFFTVCALNYLGALPFDNDDNGFQVFYKDTSGTVVVMDWPNLA